MTDGAFLTERLSRSGRLPASGCRHRLTLSAHTRRRRRSGLPGTRPSREGRERREPGHQGRHPFGQQDIPNRVLVSGGSSTLGAHGDWLPGHEWLGWGNDRLVNPRWLAWGTRDVAWDGLARKAGVPSPAVELLAPGDRGAPPGLAHRFSQSPWTFERTAAREGFDRVMGPVLLGCAPRGHCHGRGAHAPSRVGARPPPRHLLARRGPRALAGMGDRPSRPDSAVNSPFLRGALRRRKMPSGAGERVLVQAGRNSEGSLSGSGVAGAEGGI